MATAKDVIHSTLGTADYILNTYVGDLSDEDLLAVPVAGSNPIAWQWGHLIVAERSMVDSVKPGTSPGLPDGFEVAHTKETAAPNTFPRYGSKEDYLKAHKAQRAATIAALDAMTDADLDAPTGLDYAPTVHVLFNMIGVHSLGHLGQFVAVRRKLGKPVVF